MKDMLTFCNFKVIRANCSLLFLKSNRRNVKNVKSVKKMQAAKCSSGTGRI